MISIFLVLESKFSCLVFLKTIIVTALFHVFFRLFVNNSLFFIFLVFLYFHIIFFHYPCPSFGLFETTDHFHYHVPYLDPKKECPFPNHHFSYKCIFFFVISNISNWISDKLLFYFIVLPSPHIHSFADSNLILSLEFWKQLLQNLLKIIFTHSLLLKHSITALYIFSTHINVKETFGWFSSLI